MNKLIFIYARHLLSTNVYYIHGIFILIFIQTLSFSFNSYATHEYLEEERAAPLLISHTPSRSLEPPKEETDRCLFLTLPLEVHKSIFNFLDFSDLMRFSRAGKSSLYTAVEFFILSLDLRTIEKLASGTLYSSCSNNEFYNALFMAYKKDVIKIYQNSIVLEYCGDPPYSLIQSAFILNPSFKQIEAKAQKWAKRDFCLNEVDRTGHWLETCIYNSLIWHHHQDSDGKVIQWLAKKGCPLAKAFMRLMFPQEEVREPIDEEQTTSKHKLEETAVTIRQTLEVKSKRINYGYISIVRNMLRALYSDNMLHATLVALAPESTDLTLRETFDVMQGLGFTRSAIRDYLFSEDGTLDWDLYLNLLSQELSQPQDREAFFALFDWENGNRKFEQLGEKLTKITKMIIDRTIFSYEERVTRKFRELLEDDSKIFILLWQRNTPFLCGLSDQHQAHFYYQAQHSYKRQFGKVHMGQFAFSFDHPCFKREVFEYQSPYNHDKRGRFFDIVDAYISETSDAQIEVDKKGGEIWGPLVDLGDPFVMYEFAKSWANYEAGSSKKKSISWLSRCYWFCRYRDLAPSLPFGDFATLISPEE